MAKKRVLIVDDELPTLAALGKAFTLEGYIVHKASTPAEALKICAEESIDLVVLDFIMPKMDGIELLARIRQHKPLVRSVILSGKIIREIQEDLVAKELKASVEADRYLHKPVSNEKLIDCCNELLTISHAARSWKEIASDVIKSKETTIKKAKIASKKLKTMKKD